MDGVIDGALTCITKNRIPETLKKAESGDLESQLQLANYYRWEIKGDPNF